MVKWSEERGRNTKSNREGKESEEIIYGGGNRPSGLFEIQLFTSSTHIMIERQAPSLFFLNGLPFQPAPRLLWCHGSIDGSMEGSIGGESILITVGRRLFKFSEVREKRSILTHDRARRKRAHSIETIDFAFTQASKGP